MKPIVLTLLLFPLLSFVAMRVHSQEVTQPAAESKAATTFDVDRTRELLTKEIKEILDDTGIPSISIALLKDDRVVWAEAFGYSNMKLKVPASRHTIYGTGSCFKPVTARAIMQLADKGQLKLDDPINDYLGDHAVADMSATGKPVTVRHLLSHYSGLKAPHEALTGSSRSEPVWGRKLSASLEEMASELTAAEVPGTKYQYSNYGYSLAGLLIEKVSGQSYEQYIVDNIFKPVGVTIAGPVNPTPEMVEELALPYRLENHVAIPERQYRLDVLPAGDIYMSVPAMSEILLVHLNAGKHNGMTVLSETAIQEMRQPQFGGKDGLDFGIRTFDGETLIMHGGGVQGFTTKFILGVESKVGVYIASNASDVHVPLQLLAQMSIDLLRGKKIGTGLVREIVHVGVTFAADEESGMLRIAAVTPKSPASRAGLSAGPLFPGPLIEKINDVSVKGKTLKECLALMKGPAGTQVRLTLVDPTTKGTRTVVLMKQTYLAPG
ncbi:MAG: serine hydrolase [Planctomycetota bacterium]|nr:serine hydrolase [Planctomycetota bacterium]